MNKIETVLTQKTGKRVFSRHNSTWARPIADCQARQAQFELLASIRRDAAPAIQACIRASNLLDDIGVVKTLYLGADCEKSNRMAAGAAGKYATTYRTGGGDDASGMDDNAPLWTAGHAMQARDNAKE